MDDKRILWRLLSIPFWPISCKTISAPEISVPYRIHDSFVYRYGLRVFKIFVWNWTVQNVVSTFQSRLMCLSLHIIQINIIELSVYYWGLIYWPSHLNFTKFLFSFSELIRHQVSLFKSYIISLTLCCWKDDEAKSRSDIPMMWRNILTLFVL